MGNWQSFLISIGYKATPLRALILGLDAAGKTTILYRMKLGEVVSTIPTIGFNVETIKYKNVELTAWNVGGRDKIRPLFRHYYANTQIVIFVIDSNDRDRILEIEAEISKFINEDELRDCMVLIIANKQDLANAMSVDEIKKLINFDKIKQNPKHILGASAINGDGLKEAFEWISKNYTTNKTTSSLAAPFIETFTDVKQVAKAEHWTEYFKGFTHKYLKW